MRVTVLKEKLTKAIECTTDTALLEVFSSILDTRSKENGMDLWDTLSQPQKVSVTNSIENIKNGKPLKPAKSILNR